MAKGDPPANPWTETIHDTYAEYLADQAGNSHPIGIFISVPWDQATGNLLDGGFITRDPDCRLTTIVFDVPTKKKPLGPVPVGTTNFTALQIRQATTFRTLADLQSVQISAE